MKKLFMLFAIMATVCTASAQKERMWIDYFSFSTRDGHAHVNNLRNQVITGMSATERLIFIDVDTESALMIEESRRSKEGAMFDEVARMGKMKVLGAHYILSGNIDAISIDKKIIEDKKIVYFNARVKFTLKVTRVEDGSILASESFSITGGGQRLGKNPEMAVVNTVSLAKDRMKRFIDNTFPLSGSVVEMKSEKKGKMEACYINMGSAHGLSAGQFLKVYQIKMIAGRESKIEIGQLKLDVVVAADLSDCKVSKGGDLILKAFLAGDKLEVQTIARSGLGGALGL